MGDSAIIGKYKYLNSGSGDWLYLTGHFTSNAKSPKEFEMIERNDKGDQTGYMKGSFTTDKIVGTFKNYKDVTYTLTLKRI